MYSSFPENHWQELAKKWHRLASPLRPCSEDVENFRLAMGNDPGRCLLLGVTPELAEITPDITIIDNNDMMIAALLPNKANATLGDWLDLPFAGSSFNTVIGDGCLVLLSYATQYERFFKQMSNILTLGGKFLLRVFVGAEEGEDRELVCNEALSGKIKSFHAFKWRLSMAIASESHDFSVNVAETCATFNRLLPNRKRLAAASGWELSDIETIDFYRDSPARYYYPPLSQVRTTLSASFKESNMIYGHYELAERCPILVLESLT